MKTAILYNHQLQKYSFGEGHPLGKDRFKDFFDFFKSRFTGFKDEFEIIEPPPATDEDLQLVHSQDYIKAISSASEGEILSNIYRYVSPDNLNPLTGYIPRGIEKGARVIVGISLEAGELIAQKRFSKAIGIGGGMHHAKPVYGEGFCFYNDVAICIKNLKQKYNLKKILVLDTDAHAGNGTREIFYEDPEVLFIDIHQDPRTLYPGEGFIYEIGKDRGAGFTVNIPVMPGTGNQAYKYIFEEVIFPLAYEFRPELIIRYGGSDPHYLDELTNLGLTLEGFKMLGEQVNKLSKELTEGRSIDLLLSGYNTKVLPFAWSALISGLLGLNMDLTELKEESLPPEDSQLSQTREILNELKRYLKRYWRCME